MEQSYKEKYEQALAKAKEQYNYPCMRSCMGILEEIFPELKESEDERIESEDEKIRHYLMNFVKINDGVNLPPDYAKKALVWLEKQEIFGKKDVDDAYLKGVRDTKNEIEKQYEANYQTRKDIATFIFNYRGDIKDRVKWMDYLGIKVSFVGEQGEQKPIEENKGNLGGISPNWSEEDEMVRKDLIGFFKDEAFLCHKKKQIIAWLKKQGDSPIKWNKNTKDCKPQKNHSVLMKTIHGIAEGEWQGEKWFQYRWSSSIKDSDVLFWIELSDIEKQGETFPVLSNSSNSGKNEQKPADIFIEKACEWLREHRDYVATEDNGIAGWIPDVFIDNLKKYLEEQV